MNYLLFGGAPNSGKSNAVYRLAQELLMAANPLTISAGRMPVLKTPPFEHAAYVIDEDFIIILEGNDNKGNKIRIALNSKSDDRQSIDDFKAFLANEAPVDIIVSSIRNLDDPRTYFLATMPITNEDYVCEIPLAKFTKTGSWPLATDWYTNAIDSLALQTLRNNPFNL